MKKSLIKTGLIFSLFLAPLLFSAPTFAIDPDIASGEAKKQTTSTTTNNQSRSFLGMVPWDEGTSFSSDSLPSEDELTRSVWQVAANIATDISIAAAYLVIAFVIRGGYLYTFSRGDPNKVTEGKKTLTQAFIGLAITLSATLIMGSLRIALVGNSSLANCAVSTESSCVDPDDMVLSLINWFIGMAGIVSVIFLIYGGVLYITSTGDPNKVKQARNMIMYSLIGLIIVGLSATITAFVSSAIREANQNASLNLTTIAKELNEINHS